MSLAPRWGARENELVAAETVGIARDYVLAAIGHESEGVAQRHYDALDFRRHSRHGR